ncbi:hypothetical protein BSFA1_87060 (plasmid) [Burkholderia sp. SFA1]|nr:hypothetical protein BSFA1_87060 [Burkholderia sp. SFA1]
MSKPFRFDHLVVAVHSLEAAVLDYRRLGFNVSTGGRHTHAPTRNALIYFHDGAYIELIEWVNPASGEKWYERLARRGEGVIDFALCPADFSIETQRSDRRYDFYKNAAAGSRVQADGAEMHWLLGWPTDEALPFLCADVTARHLRVPEGDCRIHPNGTLGIRSVSVQVLNLDKAVQRYEGLLRSTAERIDLPWLNNAGLEAASLMVCTTRIFLVSPRTHSKVDIAQALARDLSTYGPRVYRVALAHDRQNAPPTMPLDLTHGARLTTPETDDDIESQLLPLHAAR